VVQAHPTGSADGDGPKVKDLVDRTVVMHVGQPREVTLTNDGKSRLATLIPCDTWVVDFDVPCLEHVGIVRVVQEVLVERLATHGPGAWISTEIIKPKRAYLLQHPTPQAQAVIDRLTPALPDTNAPELGLNGDPFEDDDTDGAGVNPDEPF
jgi:hypothetical protein